MKSGLASRRRIGLRGHCPPGPSSGPGHGGRSRALRLRCRARDRAEKGQITVELAVAIPVLVIALVIALDCLFYMGQCARFDEVASQRVIELAVSPPRGSYELEHRRAAVESALASEFSEQGASVEVSVEDAGVVLASMMAFRCKLSVSPWPLSEGATTVFGMAVPIKLEHEHVLVVDPYTPGELI